MNDGPAQPRGYQSKLTGLDTPLDLMKHTTRPQAEQAMESHVLEQARLIGTSGR